MKKQTWISAPLYAAAGLIIGLQPATGSAQESTTTTVQVTTTDGTTTSAPPLSKGAMPVQTVDTVTNPDGTTTVTRTRTLSATGAAPARTRTKQMTFNADGSLASQSTTEVRSASDGTILRERSSSLAITDGEVVRSRTDTHQEVQRPEKPERVTRVERPEKLDRVERIERPEKVDRPERVERPEKPERIERHTRD